MAKTSVLTLASTVKISPRGSARLKDGHVWVYRSDIVNAEGVAPGSLVRVTDHRGKPMGTALYSSSSQIAIRMISEEPVGDLTALLRQRIADAIAYRERIVHNTDAHRVVFSEGDFLPGLIVDVDRLGCEREMHAATGARLDHCAAHRTEELERELPGHRSLSPTQLSEDHLRPLHRQLARSPRSG